MIYPKIILGRLKKWGQTGPSLASDKLAMGSLLTKFAHAPEASTAAGRCSISDELEKFFLGTDLVTESYK